MDLEKYLQQQAELARQRKLLKKKAPAVNKTEPPSKKLKLAPDRKIKKKQKKEKDEDNEEESDLYNCVDKIRPELTCHSKATCSTSQEDHSESEYVPSDGELFSEDEEIKGVHKKKHSSSKSKSTLKKSLC